MSPEEYKTKLSEINKQRDKQHLDLAREYVVANSRFKIGNVITRKEDDKIIVVDKIKIDKYYTPPQWVYVGIWLTKKREPNKKQETYHIFNDERVEILANSLEEFQTPFKITVKEVDKSESIHQSENSNGLKGFFK